MSNTPEIRFEGFTDAWEQRKLGDVFKEYSEKNHTELPALTIIQGGGTVKREDSDRNLMYDESNLSNYKMVRKDDFIVHLRSFEGGLEKSSLDGIISPAYHTFHSDIADSRFYYPYFRSHEFIKHKLVPHVYGIRDGRSIDIDGMKTIEIPYTSMEEQRKIGDYLESLDYLITLHQRKSDEFRTLKKYMLQKMFPKNGEKVPEIRFEGFTDAWEQRKLGELTEPIKVKCLNSVYPVYSVTNEAGFIPQSEQFEDREVASSNKSNYSVVIKNQFAYNPSRINVGSIAYLKEDIKVIISPLYVVFQCSEQLDEEFLSEFIKTASFNNQRETLTAGSVRSNLSYDSFSNINILLPSIIEQKKIGEYFAQLDNAITLHQRKSDEFRTLKKYMLQKMFPKQ